MPRIGYPVAASTGSPQVSRSRSERDQGAMPASNAEAIRADASSVVMVDPPSVRSRRQTRVRPVIVPLLDVLLIFRSVSGRSDRR